MAISLQLPVPVGPGALPVDEPTDVRRLMPEEIRRSEDAPVRDAIASMLEAMLLRHQSQATYAAAQADDLRAIGIYLDAVGEEVEVPRLAEEEDDDYRARILKDPELVTPNAIRGEVDKLLAQVTPIKSQLFESIQDRMYIFDGRGDYAAFVGASPSYPDRLYSDSGLPVVRPQSAPGGAWIFGDTYGRYFVLRVPELGSTLDNFPVVLGTPPASLADSEPALFVSDGTGDDAAYLSSTSVTAETLFGAIVNVIERAKGAGIRWQVIADPTLTG